MAWTTPRDWTTGELVTASYMNINVRDNMNETAVAKVTTQGDTVYGTGNHALARLAKGTAYQKLGMNAGATAPEWQNGGMEEILTQLPSGTSSISFGSIPATFKHLRAVGLIAGTTAAQVLLQFNGDSTASYNYQTLTADNLTVGSGKIISGTAIQIASVNTAAASNSIAFDIMIPNYLNTALYKSLIASGSSSNTTGSQQYIGIFSGMWLNLAAISSIQFSLTGGLFDSSTISLYGMR